MGGLVDVFYVFAPEEVFCEFFEMVLVGEFYQLDGFGGFFDGEPLLFGGGVGAGLAVDDDVVVGFGFGLDGDGEVEVFAVDDDWSDVEHMGVDGGEEGDVAVGHDDGSAGGYGVAGGSGGGGYDEAVGADGDLILVINVYYDGDEVGVAFFKDDVVEGVAEGFAGLVFEEEAASELGGVFAGED